MMVKCSVIGCRSRKQENQKSLSLHRLPNGESRRKKWLEAIGSQNIKLHLKNVFICSLHFPTTAFNYTLDVIRLRDDAVPLQLQGKVPVGSTTTVPTQTVHDTPRVPVPSPRVPVESTTTVLTQPVHNKAEVSVPSLRVPVASTTTVPTQPVHDTTGVPVPSLRVRVLSATTIPTQPVHDTTQVPVPCLREQTKIKNLEQKCDSLRKKIKILHQTIRRQTKRIANFRNIIKDLKERNLMNNESSIILEACVGQKDFLNRQSLKSEDLPFEEQYSEETRKFALTLHLFSPKAYDFVRRTYNTCLPHPKTLSKWYHKNDAEPGAC